MWYAILMKVRFYWFYPVPGPYDIENSKTSSRKTFAAGRPPVFPTK